MQFAFDDGGRAAAGYKGQTGDCGVRAAAIVTGRPYQEIYDRVIELARRERMTKRNRRRSHPRTGISVPTYRKLMAGYGFTWIPAMGIGTGCTVHLADGEVPMDRLIVCRVSKHFVAVVHGVIRDTGDPSRDGTRCVYGWWERRR